MATSLLPKDQGQCHGQSPVNANCRFNTLHVCHHIHLCSDLWLYQLWIESHLPATALWWWKQPPRPVIRTKIKTGKKLVDCLVFFRLLVVRVRLERKDQRTGQVESTTQEQIIARTKQFTQAVVFAALMVLKHSGVGSGLVVMVQAEHDCGVYPACAVTNTVPVNRTSRTLGYTIIKHDKFLLRYLQHILVHVRARTDDDSETITA